MGGLPAYSGPRVQCPKCAIPRVTTKYQADTGLSRSTRFGGPGEGLIRTCQNCGYKWAEACAPGASAAAGQDTQ